MLYDSKLISPPFKPYSFDAKKFDANKLNKENTKNTKTKNFDSSSKHPMLSKFNKKVKKQEVGLYLKFSKLKENLSCNKREKWF